MVLWFSRVSPDTVLCPLRHTALKIPLALWPPTEPPLQAGPGRQSLCARILPCRPGRGEASPATIPLCNLHITAA